MCPRIYLALLSHNVVEISYKKEHLLISIKCSNWPEKQRVAVEYYDFAIRIYRPSLQEFYSSSPP